MYNNKKNNMNLNKQEDEYNWKNYTPEYSDQLIGMVKNEGFDFFVKNYEIINNNPVFHDNLVSNWKEIYSLIYKINPKSIFEFGCGACYHLRNIMTLCPEIKVSGADYLGTQIEFGKEFIPEGMEFPKNVSVRDLTEDVSDIPKAELVYSQAVVMHLNSEKAVKMIQNMGEVAEKYIIMVEGVRNHENWYDLVNYALPDWKMTLTNNYIDYGIILERK
jgi:trans-aconitate methyltransferase